ncbi:hypothetical protein BV898_08854 [Hypsibius exemplaris]|uniref:Uncharacterized protein n=1 Tax=Hypsibius exemplaris TaxID=2072580 RepID=A0A1W0WP84_HYPEX|nr:hypothetical protein BV898_08854 [Hypsibius exemplaris]
MARFSTVTFLLASLFLIATITGTASTNSSVITPSSTSTNSTTTEATTSVITPSPTSTNSSVITPSPTSTNSTTTETATSVISPSPTSTPSTISSPNKETAKDTPAEAAASATDALKIPPPTTLATTSAKESFTCQYHHCKIRHYLNDTHTFTCTNDCTGIPLNGSIGFANPANNTSCNMSSIPFYLAATDRRRKDIIPPFNFQNTEQYYKQLASTNLVRGPGPFLQLPTNLTFPNAASFCTFYTSGNEPNQNSRFECVLSLSGNSSNDIEYLWYGIYTGGRLSSPDFNAKMVNTYGTTRDHISMAERWNFLKDSCSAYKSTGHSDFLTAYHALVYLLAAYWFLM